MKAPIGMHATLERSTPGRWQIDLGTAVRWIQGMGCLSWLQVLQFDWRFSLCLAPFCGHCWPPSPRMFAYPGKLCLAPFYGYCWPPSPRVFGFPGMICVALRALLASFSSGVCLSWHALSSSLLATISLGVKQSRRALSRSRLWALMAALSSGVCLSRRAWSRSLLV